MQVTDLPDLDKTVMLAEADRQIADIKEAHKGEFDLRMGIAPNMLPGARRVSCRSGIKPSLFGVVPSPVGAWT